MKPPPFEYFDPTTIEEAVGLLGQFDNAKLLAGGQSLMPMLNMRFLFPDQVIDLNRIPELSGIRQDGDALTFGAMTRQRDIERSAVVAEILPILVEGLKEVGHLQTRNRGTIGGSLTHLDPAAELVSLAMLYEARVSVQGPGGAREVPFSDFVLGYMTPSIGFDELVTAIRFDAWPAFHGYGFCEYARRHGDFAIVSASVLVTLEAGAIARAAFVLGGVDAIPLKMTDIEAALIGQRPGKALYEDVAERCRRIDAMADSLIPADYRQHLAGVLGRRALEAAIVRCNINVGAGG